MPTVFTRRRSFWLPLSLRSTLAAPLLAMITRSRSPSLSMSRIGRAPSDDWLLQSLAKRGSHLLKLLLAEIAEQVRRLSVANVGLDDADVVRNVAIDGKDVRQTVEVVIEEKCAEG